MGDVVSVEPGPLAPPPPQTLTLVNGVWTSELEAYSPVPAVRYVTGDPIYRFLKAEEECLLWSRRHWVVPLVSMAQGFGSTMVLILLTFLITWLLPSMWLINALLWVAAMVHWGYVVWRILLWRTDYVVVTDERMLRRKGIFTTEIKMAKLDEITNADYFQSFPGKVLGYGTIVILTAGDQEDSLREVDMLPCPLAFYQAVS